MNRSLFRVNRDTRFSPNKTPYKTHLGILFWEGINPRSIIMDFGRVSRFLKEKRD